MNGLRRINWLGLSTVGALTLAWYVLVETRVLDYNGVPGPIEVIGGFDELLEAGTLWDDLLHTTWVVFISSLLAAVIGIVVGTALGLSRFVRTYSMGTVDFLRSIPMVTLLPVMIIVSGPRTRTEVIIATFAACQPMIINTAMAFRQINPRLGDVARTFRLGRWETFRKVWFPSIVPQILVGARLAVVTATILTILAETFVNPNGLGWGLIRSQYAMQIDQMWAYAVLIGFFGYALNVGLVHGFRVLAPGGRANPAMVGA